jgi:hypothetical protein
MKVAERIRKKILRFKPGTTFQYQDLDIEPNEFGAAAKAIERYIAKNQIKRISTGVFYVPKNSLFGELKPNETELLKPYIFENNKRIAYITGIALYNKMGLTTQIPRIIKIACRGKRISVNTGNLKAKPVSSYIDVTNENFYLLELLDVMKDFSKIPDLDKKMAINFLSQKLYELPEKELSKLISFALKYPPRTRAFLGALLDSENKKINAEKLMQSLNPLTTFELGVSNELLPTATKWNIK